MSWYWYLQPHPSVNVCSTSFSLTYQLASTAGFGFRLGLEVYSGTVRPWRAAASDESRVGEIGPRVRVLDGSAKGGPGLGGTFASVLRVRRVVG